MNEEKEHADTDIALLVSLYKSFLFTKKDIQIFEYLRKKEESDGASKGG